MLLRKLTIYRYNIYYLTCDIFSYIYNIYLYISNFSLGISRAQLAIYMKNLKNLTPDCEGVKRLPVKKVIFKTDKEGKACLFTSIVYLFFSFLPLHV